MRTDSFLERNRRIFSYEAASSRDVRSVQNWLDGNACLAREESAYIEHFKDLLRVPSSDDNAVTRLEAVVEDCIIWFCKRFRKVRYFGQSCYRTS